MPRLSPESTTQSATSRALLDAGSVKKSADRCDVKDWVSASGAVGAPAYKANGLLCLVEDTVAVSAVACVDAKPAVSKLKQRPPAMIATKVHALPGNAAVRIAQLSLCIGIFVFSLVQE